MPDSMFSKCSYRNFNSTNVYRSEYNIKISIQVDLSKSIKSASAVRSPINRILPINFNLSLVCFVHILWLYTSSSFLSFYSSIFVLSIFIFSSYMCKQQCLVWHIFPKCRIPWQSRTESTTSRLHTNHSKQTPTRSPGNNHCFAFAANSFLLRLLWFGFAFIHSCLPSVFSVHIRLRIYCSVAAVDVVASERATKKRRKKIRPTTMTTYRHF